MEEFDIQISMNGVKSEISTKSSRFEGEPNDASSEMDNPKVNKKDWADTLSTLTKQFKDITGYKTPEQLKVIKEKELAEKGTKYKVFGLNPFVAIGLSFGLILVGSYFVVKIKSK